MTTQERLERYQELLQIASTDAQVFLEENREADKRFASIAMLHSALLSGFKKRAETDPLIDAIEEEIIQRAPAIARSVASRMAAAAG